MPRKKHDTSGTARNHRAMKSGGRGHQRNRRRRRAYTTPAWVYAHSTEEQAVLAVKHADGLTALLASKN